MPPHPSITRTAETGSTNADLLAQLASGVPLAEGEWLVADRQTFGRGRQGRGWHSPPGNFHGSTVVNLIPNDPAGPTLALAIAVAMHDAIVDVSGGRLTPMIKWPNDLLVRDAKLAGTLLERRGDSVVVGIGVNLAWAPDLPDRRTCSLSDCGVRIEPEAFAATLAPLVDQALVRWRAEPLSQTIAAWTDRAHPLGTMLSIGDGDAAGLTGAFDGLNGDGSLKLRLPGGEVRIVRAGEVHVAVPVIATNRA